MTPQKFRRNSGLATPSRTSKVWFVTNTGTFPVTVGNQIKISGYSTTPSKLLLERELNSFQSFLKALALNLSTLPELLPKEFIFGYIFQVLQIIIKHDKPCAVLKEFFFQAQIVSFNTHYPQEGKWVRYPLTVPKVRGHQKLQKVVNLPSSVLQYYLLEAQILCKGSVLTLMRPMELIWQSIDYSYKTMVAPSLADQSLIKDVISYIPEFLREFAPDKYDPSETTHLYASYQRGPNGKQAIAEFMEDLKSLHDDPELLQAVMNLTKLTNPAMYNLFSSFDVDEMGTEEYCHSKLTYIEDGKFGKTRQIAIGDMLSQSCLTGINDVFMNILQKNKVNDVTFCQSSLPNYIRYHSFPNGDLPASSDATAFTDRLPRELNQAIGIGILGKEIGELWYKVLFERTFIASQSAVSNGVPKALKYAVGSPMGLLTSWSSSAIVHHLIIRYAFQKAGINDYKYIVLGDDVCIWNRSVYEIYIDTITGLGVEVSKMKSTNSTSYCEFAKRLFTKEDKVIVEITGLPGMASAKLASADPTGIAGYLDQLSGRSSFGAVKASLDFDSPKPGYAAIRSLIQLLIYLYRVNIVAYKRCLDYIATWVFTDRCSMLYYTIRMTEQWIPMGTEVLSSIHDVPVNASMVSIADFLNLQDLPYLQKSSRLAIYQSLVLRDLQNNLGMYSTNLSSFADDTGSVELVLVVEILQNLTSRLSRKVLDFLFSDVDMLSDEAVKLLFDYRSTDLLNRADQICSRQEIRRREISFVRESKIGKDLRALLDDQSTEEMIVNYRFTDYFSEYSDLSQQIDNAIRQLDLGEIQTSYLQYVDKLFSEK